MATERVRRCVVLTDSFEGGVFVELLARLLLLIHGCYVAQNRVRVLLVHIVVDLPAF